jgi:TRAP-type mannitol/chloroaromatic compound transport system substrate-binding protein
MRKALVLGFVILMGMTLAGGTSQAAEKVTQWKLQTLWSAGELPYKVLEDFCGRVKTATGGRLEIQPFPAGGIVPTFETLDAVKNNIIQVQNTWPGYFVGKEPAFAPLTDLVFAYTEPWEYDGFYHYGGGLELINELYEPYNAVTIGVVLWGRESMSVKKPVMQPEDFKGMKIRSPQGMTADMLKMLGAGVVVLPGDETYSALDKGVVDGADWSTPSVNYRMGFNRVAKYYIYPEYRSMPISDFTVNKKAWEALPADIQQILKDMVRTLNYDQLARCAMDDIQAMKEMDEKGVKPLTWKTEDIERLRKLIREQVWTDWATKSPLAKKAIDAQTAWLKKLGRL